MARSRLLTFNSKSGALAPNPGLGPGKWPNRDKCQLRKAKCLKLANLKPKVTVPRRPKSQTLLGKTDKPQRPYEAICRFICRFTYSDPDMQRISGFSKARNIGA